MKRQGWEKEGGQAMWLLPYEILKCFFECLAECSKSLELALAKKGA